MLIKGFYFPGSNGIFFLELFQQTLRADFYTFFPDNFVIVPENEFNASTADIHYKGNFIDFHGGLYTHLDVFCLKVAGNYICLNSGNRFYSPHHILGI